MPHVPCTLLINLILCSQATQYKKAAQVAGKKKPGKKHCDTDSQTPMGVRSRAAIYIVGHETFLIDIDPSLNSH